ncbi:MAG: mannose-6-phosphate isomerase [Bacteroidales bacterium]|nr:mannose-6-phosphate isomerase [Bacteroidales bacterium]
MLILSYKNNQNLYKMLYPIKFKPIYKQRIWGGDGLKKFLNKHDAPENCGESWEIACVNNDISLVENGFLAGNNLAELIEIYMGDLVGDKVYEVFGNNFPLLIKFIDAKDDLSYQVHPADEYAYENHNSFGKTEMWYIMNVEKGANLVAGFSKKTNQTEFLKYIEEGKLNEIVNHVPVKPGDIVYLPSGRIHSTGKGIMLAEIQQSSDITYRVWDFNRIDKDGKARDLHIEDALKVLDFSHLENPLTEYKKLENASSPIIKSEYFICNSLNVSNILEHDYARVDSFVILICVNGSTKIKANNESLNISKGETLLIPAEITEVRIEAINGNVEFLEVFIDSDRLK